MTWTPLRPFTYDLSMKTATLTLTLALGLAACGDDTSPPPPPPMDASTDRTLPTRDTGASDTGGATDASDAEASQCDVVELDMPTDFIATPRPVSVEVSDEGFIIAYRQTGDDGDVYVSRVGLGPDQTNVTTEPLVAEPGTTTNVVVNAGMAVWEDDLNERVEKTIRAYPVQPAPGDSILDVTSRTGDARAPVVARFEGGNWIFGYFEAAGDQWNITVRSWDGSTLGNPQVLDTVPAVGQLSLSQAGDHMMAAWQKPNGSGGDIWLRPLGTDASPTGPAQIVSTEGNAVGPVQIAFHENGGAVIFEVSVSGRPEVRSRLLNLDGSPKRAEQVVSLAPPQGRNAALITYSGGFASVYHERLLGGGAPESVKLNFIHGSDGNVVFELPLGTAGFDDGLPGLAVSPDGEIVAAWAEVMPTGTRIRAVKISCPVAWLRCSPPEDA